MEERHNYWNSDEAAKRLLSFKNSPAPRLQRTLEISYESVRDFLNEVSDAESRLRRLLSLCSIVSECFVVLLIEAQNHATAYDLFESLNYRGMPLTQADLIKNEVIKSAANADSRDEIVEAWGEIKAEIASHEILLPDLIHYSYLSRWEFVKASNLFPAIKSKVSSIGASTYVEGLSEDSEALDYLIRGDNTRWKKTTNDTLRDLKEVLGYKLVYVFLLAAYRRSAGNRDDFDQFVQVGANFAFRFMKVMDGGIEQLAKAMRDSAEMVRSGSGASDIGNQLRDDYAPNSLFIDKFATYGVSSAKLGYYVVYAIEKAKLSGTVPLDHGVEQHLEHIMPKAPRATSWPEATELKHADPDNFREYLWRVGNLLPLPREINSAIKNFSIDRKISSSDNRDYMHCSLQSPKEISSYLEDGRWTLTSIQNRQRELATAFASSAWPL